MLIPSSYASVLLLAIATAILWGVWANTFKLAGRHRFEIYYLDFAFGALLVSLMAAFTVGTMGADITFADNLSIVRRLQLGYALAAGSLCNLGMMLLLAAISIAGVAVAFPISMGTALVAVVAIDYVVSPQGNPALLFTGCVVEVIAVVCTALAYKRLQAVLTVELAHAAAVTGRKRVRKRTATKGVVTGLASGVLVGGAFPLVDLARSGGEIEMGPYPLAVVFAGGVFLSTLLFSLYFFNLPMQGPPVSIVEYFRCSRKQHALAVVGGLLWGAGVVCCVTAAGALPDAGLVPEAVYALGLGAGVVAALCALLYWRELGRSARVRIMMWASVGALAVGVALICAALLLGRNKPG